MACEMNLDINWQPIRIVRRIDASDSVSVEEEIHLAIRMLPLLEDAEMRQLLKHILKARGWTEAEDGSLSKDIDGALATLSADGKELRLRQAESAEVSTSATVRVDRSKSRAEESAKKLLKEQLGALKDKEEGRLRGEALRKLTALEPELRAELQRALNQTYRRALEEKARRMGELESLQERGDEGGSYEVTVVVKA